MESLYNYIHIYLINPCWTLNHMGLSFISWFADKNVHHWINSKRGDTSDSNLHFGCLFICTRITRSKRLVTNHSYWQFITVPNSLERLLNSCIEQFEYRLNPQKTTNTLSPIVEVCVWYEKVLAYNRVRASNLWVFASKANVTDVLCEKASRHLIAVLNGPKNR